MTIRNKYGFTAGLFILSCFIVGILTFSSFILAWAYDEGTIYEPVGIVGHYLFLVLRLPTHNLIWQRPALIEKLFFPGLLVNIVIYSLAITFAVSKIYNKRPQVK